MKKLLRKMMSKTTWLFTSEEIRAANALLSNKKAVYNNYYMELGE